MTTSQSRSSFTIEQDGWTYVTGRETLKMMFRGQMQLTLPLASTVNGTRCQRWTSIETHTAPRSLRGGRGD